MAEIARAVRVLVAGTFQPQEICDALSVRLRARQSRYIVENVWRKDVAHQLADPSGLLSSNPGGMIVILVRLSDWNNFDHALPYIECATLMRRRTANIVDRLRLEAPGYSGKLLIYICPGQSGLHMHASWRWELASVETELAVALAGIPNLEVRRSIENPNTGVDSNQVDALGVPSYSPRVADHIARDLGKWIAEVSAHR